MAMQDAFLLAGASSPARGSMSCGVTVVIPQRNDMAQKTRKFTVRQSTTHCTAWGPDC